MARNKILSASFAAMVGAAVFASGGSASAGIAFTINPLADGLCNFPAPTCLPPVLADQIAGSYSANILQTVGGSNPFTETGGFLFNSYLLGGLDVPASTSGLNLGNILGFHGYTMFANFQAAGTATFTLPTSAAATFTSFTIQLYGLPGATAPPRIATTQEFPTAGTVLLATTTLLVSGDAHVFFTGPAQGDYHIFSNFVLTNPQGTTYFTSLASLLNLELSNSGNNNTATDCSSTTGIVASPLSGLLSGTTGSYCIGVAGGGIAEFLAIPEPTSLALLGMGLLALGMISRRRKTAA